MPLNNTVSVILPGVVIAVAAIVVFVADLFLKRKTALAWIAVAGLLCGAAVAIGQWGEWTAAPHSSPATAIQASAPLRLRKRSAPKTTIAATATTTPGRITETVLFSGI